MSLAILILAGGEGRRMGGAKPFRLLGGSSLLDRAMRRARSWSEEVAVAVRDPGPFVAVDLPCLEDAPGLEGPIAGLASALRLRGDLVLTIPCDMPFLPDDLPERLEAALPGNAAAMAGSAGRPQPVCTLWRKAALVRIHEYASTGRRSLIGFAESVGFTTVEWPESTLFNVNSGEDLRRAESML